jgi:pimeloyl-ACP methyl ester carboxylesterase
MRARITATRWPDPELVADHSQGVQQAVIQELARYWATEYDLRRCEGSRPHRTCLVDLMKRLGYPRYIAQGGDWGAIITDLMAVQAPPGLLGMHTNMPGVVPPDVSAALARNVLGAGGLPPSGLSAEESSTYEQLNFLYTKGLGYGVEMGTQPQTLGEPLRLLRRQERVHPGRRERLPARVLQGPAQLGRAGLPQAHLLQRGRPRLPLRRLAGAGAVHR